jgi:aspartyl-tRNA(Asn)/glutamyl-tRNA(Gln) amidotransferase subunit A
MGADRELCFASARHLAELMASGRVSSLEIVRNALARLDAVEPALNTFTHRDDEGALAAARAADARRRAGGEAPPLLGIPVSVKDLIEVEGMPCSYGSLTMRGYVAPADAPSVARLRAAGTIILGKTTTSEFGFRGYTESPVHGVTRNAWDRARTPGGSSGGAASSVAAGVTPFALATDGGGSIRAPCSLTGLVGIKAQFGRVPIFPASATHTLAHVGPIARDVADAAMLLHVVAGADERDWTSLQPPLGEAPGAALPLAGLRIAFSPTLGYARVDPEIAGIVAAAVERLRATWPSIATVERVCDEEGEILSAEFIGGCSARLGRAVDDTPELVDPDLCKAILALRARSARDFTDLLRRRLVLRERLREFFTRFDVLLTPTTPAAAWEIGRYVPEFLANAKVWSFFTYPFNLSGQPAASLNCGYTEIGLPVGLQVVVRAQAEALQLGVLAECERLLLGFTPPHELREDVPARRP